MKFKKKRVRIVKNDYPYFKEIDLECFEVNGYEFGWNKEESEVLEFTYIYSGQGFNGSFVKNKNKVIDSFNMRVGAIGSKKFWGIIKNAKSVDEQIELKKQQAISNKTKRVIWEKVQKLFGFGIKTSLLTGLTGKFSIDILALDDTLKRRFGSSYPDNMSMNDFITKTYGKEVSEMITEII